MNSHWAKYNPNDEEIIQIYNISGNKFPMLYSLLNCVIYWFHPKTYLLIYSRKELRDQLFPHRLPILPIFCVYVVDLNFISLNLNIFWKKNSKSMQHFMTFIGNQTMLLQRTYLKRILTVGILCWYDFQNGMQSEERMK